MDFQQQAYQCLIKDDYSQALTLYQQLLEAEPTVTDLYWYLGLAFLLKGDEAAAQATWLLPIIEIKPEEAEKLAAELIRVLQIEAERQESLESFSTAWAIRQYVREFGPRNLNNLLKLVQLAIKLKIFTGDELASLSILELLDPKEAIRFDLDLLLQTLRDILDYAPFSLTSANFAEACLAYAEQLPGLIDVLWFAAHKIGRLERRPEFAIPIAELCLQLNADNRAVLPHLSDFYQMAGEYAKAVKTAKLYLSLSQDLPEKVFANHCLLQALMMTGGCWDEVFSVLWQQKSLMAALVEARPQPLERRIALRLFVMAYPPPHLTDEPKKIKPVLNQIAQFCQSNIEIYAKEQAERYRQPRSDRNKATATSKSLKIGYLSSCLRTHSVGWLARWIFQYHDYDHFEVHAYIISRNSHGYDPLQSWYTQQVPHLYDGKLDGSEIAEQIYQDKINILIDLDSITMDAACEVMALKPAPVQATWLGFDASGISTINYFIADPYVLPESAQDYYIETIWRLPQTYLAVDGFEVGIPTLRRDQLNIPNDAVIYYSVQRGNKLHPDTARLQIKILREVANSYFLIKGRSDQESVRRFFEQISEEEGVESDRLRFLPRDASEAAHRANLGIADVVLDTYPYNGATTTLETLWMGIPLVTRVGQQFAARNSYAFMMNVGVTEGIAWTDEEYVEWGVRLGKDAALRQQVAWKLKASRQTSPLWNAKQFTRDMETAFQQMWQRYVEAAS